MICLRISLAQRVVRMARLKGMLWRYFALDTWLNGLFIMLRTRNRLLKLPGEAHVTGFTFEEILALV